MFVFGFHADALERAVQKVCGTFLKLWSYGTGTFTLKRQNLETKQIKSHVLSYVFLTSIAFFFMYSF